MRDITDLDRLQTSIDQMASRLAYTPDRPQDERVYYKFRLLRMAKLAIGLPARKPLDHMEGMELYNLIDQLTAYELRLLPITL